MLVWLCSNLSIAGEAGLSTLYQESFCDINFSLKLTGAAQKKIPALTTRAGKHAENRKTGGG
jgi:hypothetical protein